MNKAKIVPVILSGGFGTRLWPMSRQKMPKQFLTCIFEEDTLFAKSLKLTNNSQIFLPPLIVTNLEHKFLVLNECNKRNIKPSAILLEPCSKNTAAAILLACIKAAEIYKDEKIKLLILPSDHLIDPKIRFEESIINACEVTNDRIVTFGVSPTFPSTGYGYIHRGTSISDNCFEIDKFLEKPDEEKAKIFAKSNNYYWNAGIFLMQSGVYMREAEKYLSDQIKVVKESLKNTEKEGVFFEIKEEDYSKADDISVDYAILEKSEKIAVTKLKSNWNDVGDYSSIFDVKEKDADNNVTFGDVETYDTKNSLIHSSNKLIATLGLNNIIAIETDDAILVADKNRSQDVRKITKDLQKKNKDEVKFHNRVYRPWGYYETLSHGSGFKVKRILVRPSSSLSLQMHEYRSEHWVVIKGTATVQNDGKTYDLQMGESTFIPIKSKHRLTNNVKEDLEIIEVQIGQKVDEDDIIRFEDVYNRK